MNYAKMKRDELVNELKAAHEANKVWLDRCTEMESQLASSRLVFQPIYQRFRAEDSGCPCEQCCAMRTLFEKPGGRTLVEEYREQRMAIEEAFQILAALIADDEVSPGRVKKAVVWLAKLSGRKVFR